MTGDEIRQRNIETMGDKIGIQYTEVFFEVSALNLYWHEYIELFGKNEEQIAILNEVAPAFFRMLQDQQFEANMLHLARITDPPKSLGKLNLTVCALPELVADQRLKQQLLTLVDELKQKTEFCRDWRNRHLAHRDLLLSLNDKQAKPLALATRKHFNGALKAISEIMNVVENFYYNNYCSFEDVITHNGAATLIYVLKMGLKQRNWKQQEIAKGNFSVIGDE